MAKYILSPRRQTKILESLSGPPYPAKAKLPFAAGREIQILHSMSKNGPLLVDMDKRTATQVNRSSDVRATPVVQYAKPFKRKMRQAAFYGLEAPVPPHPRGGTHVKIKVKEINPKGKWVPVESGIVVTALCNVSPIKGDWHATNEKGEADLLLEGKSIKRLYCECFWGWGAFRKNIDKHPMELRLEPIKLFRDCIRRYYPRSHFNPRTGVTVGVIDTGVGPHVDLNVVGGRNCTLEGNSKDYLDCDKHGTHVAGIIGARGRKPFGMLRGLAPGVPIRSYRVFGESDADNYKVAHALRQASADKCDIVNVSIEDGTNEDILRKAMIDARNQGMLVVVAAGNDYRKDVNYPAAYPGAVAVSAMGCEGTFPSGAMEEIAIERPPRSTRNPKEFVASFSNVGGQISVIALGVGVLSTIPGNSYAPCSGTSMAAPVVTGAAASLLSQNPNIYNMPRNRARSDAIEKLLLTNCVKRGFGMAYEGYGMPDPAKV